MPPKGKLWELYTALDDQLDDGEYEKAIETADTSMFPPLIFSFLTTNLPSCFIVLSIDAKEDLALRSKVFALVQLGHYDQVKEITSDYDGEDEDMLFAKAYAFYKEKRFKDALDSTLSVSSLSNSLGIAHLKAQCV